MIRSILIITLSLLASLGAAQATPVTGNITGVVADSLTQQPLPDAYIVLNGTVYYAISNEDGSFLIQDVPAGKYTLKIALMTYRTYSQEIVVTTGSRVEIAAPMQAMAFELDPIVITATRGQQFRRDVPVIVNVLDRQLLDVTHSIAVSDGLSYQPGLRVENNCQNCGFTQVRMNGLEGPYSQILVNGKPTFSSLNMVYGLEQIPASIVDRVEVVRGGGSALYGGNAIAGTINIITKEPLANYHEVGYGRSYIRGESSDQNVNAIASIITRARDSGLTAFGVLRDREPFDADGDGYSEIPKLRSYSMGINGFHRATPLRKLSLGLHGTHEERRGGNRFDHPPHEADIAEAVEHDIYGANLGYNHFFESENEQAVQAYIAVQQTNRDSYYGAGRDPHAYGQTKGFVTTAGTQYDYDFSMLGGKRLTLGVDGKYDGLDDDAPGYDRYIDQKITQYGTFAQANWKFNNTLTVLVGTRVDKHSEIENPIVVPRASVLLEMGKRLQLRAAAATGYRAPQTFDEDLHIEAVGGAVQLIHNAEDLTAEHSASGSASLDWAGDASWASWGITLEGFYTELYDAFVLEETQPDDDGNMILERRNGGGAVVAGGTLEIRGAFFEKSMEFQGGLTVQSSVYDEPMEWAEDKFTSKMLRSPGVYGYYALSYNATRSLKLSLSGKFTGSMYVPHYAGYIPEDRLERTQTFLETNLKAAYTITLGPRVPGFEFQIGVLNLFDEYQTDFDRGGFRDAGYVYGPMHPRTGFLAIKFGR